MSEGVRVIEHNYGTKAKKEVALADVVISDVGERVFWIDLPDPAELRNLAGVGIEVEALDSLKEDLETDMVSHRGNVFRFDIAYVLYDEWSEAKQFAVRKVRCLLGARFLVTCHEGESPLTEAINRGYVTDFRESAKSAVFLVYEMFQRVLESYLRIHRSLQAGLKSIDEKLASSDDGLIETAAKLHADMLALRETAHLSRNVLNHLASRASLFISANTRPYLDNMSMTLERLDDDLSTDRQIISDSVSLYVSMVSYRMNISIKAMTAVSVIFVPLTLLSSIYGMNFVAMPEIRWRYGYAFFWALFFTIAGISVLWLRKKR